MELVETHKREYSSGQRLIHRGFANLGWYIWLLFMAGITILPFLWIFFASFKGPTDAIFSIPPQLLPHAPTIDNYVRVWNQLPIANFAGSLPAGEDEVPRPRLDFLHLAGNAGRARAADLYPKFCAGRAGL
jgi:ABC-type glycerol-3-phosphate transport system permease component